MSHQKFQHEPQQSPQQAPQREIQPVPDYFDHLKYAKWIREEWIALEWHTDNQRVSLQIFQDLRRELELAERFKLTPVNQYLEEHWPREADSHVLWLFRYVEAMVRYTQTCVKALGRMSEKLEGRCNDAWEDLALCLTIGESILHSAVKDINEVVGDYRPPGPDGDQDPPTLHVIVRGLEEVEAAINKLCTKVSNVCYKTLKKECHED